MFHPDRDGAYRSSLLEEVWGIEHAFGSRGFPLGLLGSKTATLRQIHSTSALLIENFEGCAGEGDALITAAPGQRVAVHTADCIPILIASRKERIVAAVHAGWRGTAANIAGRTVEQIIREFRIDPGELAVAAGPGIGPCCYEVGPEVVELFRSLFPDLPVNGKVYLDLAEANRRQLEAAGVDPRRIDIAALCTCCRGDEFFSYRRDPHETGRMRSVIGIKA